MFQANRFPLKKNTYSSFITIMASFFSWKSLHPCLFFGFVLTLFSPLYGQLQDTCLASAYVRFISVQSTTSATVFNGAGFKVTPGTEFRYLIQFQGRNSQERINGQTQQYGPHSLLITRRIERYLTPTYGGETEIYENTLTEHYFEETDEDLLLLINGTNTYNSLRPITLPLGVYKFIFQVRIETPTGGLYCDPPPEDMITEREFLVSVGTPFWNCSSSASVLADGLVDRTVVENPETPNYNLILRESGHISELFEEIEGRYVRRISGVPAGFSLPIFFFGEWSFNQITDVLGYQLQQRDPVSDLVVTLEVRQFPDESNLATEASLPLIPPQEIIHQSGELPFSPSSEGNRTYFKYYFSQRPGIYHFIVNASLNASLMSPIDDYCSNATSGALNHTQEFIVYVEPNPFYEKQANGIGASFLAGHQVDAWRGAFIQKNTDLSIPSIGFPFVWSRIANSNYVHYDSELGRSWWSPFFQRFYPCGGTRPQDLGYKTADGHTEIFKYKPETESWESPKGVFLELTHDIDAQEFILTGEEGTKYRFYNFNLVEWYGIDICGFDSFTGRLKSIEDRFGNICTLNYKVDEFERYLLDTITDTSGQTIIFQHNAQGLIEKITDFTGREIEYQYYENGDPFGDEGNLKLVKFPEVVGNTFQHDYSGANRIQIEYRYDAQHQNIFVRDALTQMIDAKGQIYLQNTYSEINPDLNAPQSPESQEEKLQFGRITSQQYGNGQFDFSYEKEPGSLPDGAGEAKLLVIENDRRGLVREIYANEQGNPILTRNYTGAANKTQPTTRTSNRPTGKTRPNDPDFFETKAEYNAEGLVTKITSPEGNVTTYAYSGTDVRHGQNNVIRVGVQNRENPSDELVTTLTYEANFQMLKSSTDPKGNVTTYTYDYELAGANGNGVGVVREITHPTVTKGLAASEGNQESSEAFQYNAFGQLTKHTDAEGKVVDYVYYPHLNGSATGGYLKEVIVDPAGLALKTIYAYDAVGNLIKKTDPSGREFTFVVNELNQVVKTETPALMTFTEDGGEKYETITWYDKNGNVEKVWNELKNSFNDADANVPGFESANHYETQFTYDILDNVKQVKKEAVNHPEMQAYLLQIYDYDENENVTRIRYKSLPNEEIITLFNAENMASSGSDVEKERFVYDERGLLFKHIVGAGEAGASITRYNYTPNGKIKKVISANSENTLTYGYDGFARLKWIENAVNTKVIYEYDQNSNLIETRIHGEESSFGGGGGEPIPLMSVQEAGSGAIELLWKGQYLYDERDRNHQRKSFFRNLTSTGTMETTQEKISYLKNNQVFKTLNPNGNATKITYDSANRVSEIEDAFKNRKLFTYDNNSNVIKTVTHEKTESNSSAGTFKHFFAYDELNRVRETKDDLNHKTRMKLDSRGLTSLLTEAQGNTTEMRYDGIGRQVNKQIEAQGGLILHESIYDSRSRLVKLRDGNNKTTEYDYDSHNRLIWRKNADGTERSYVYDEESNLKQLIRENGDIIERFYDEINRVKEVQYQRSGGQIQMIEKFNYNGLNHLTQAETTMSAPGVNQGSKIQYETDSHGRTLSCTQQIFDSESGSYFPAKRFEMSYDELGNLLSMTYPGGRVVTYEQYNKLELPKQVKTQGFMGTGEQNTLVQYEYQGFGRLAKRTVNQVMELTPTYDEIKRVSTFQHKFNGVVGAEFRETYNKVHSKRAEEFVDDFNGIHTASVFRLDPHQRVTGFVKNLPIALKETALNDFMAIVPTDGEDYQKITYDESNNIEKVVTGSGTQNRTHNEMNELTSIAGTRTNLLYDDLGRLISYEEGDDFVEFFWNERDQLTSFSRNGNVVASYEYFPSSTPMRAIKRVEGGKNEAFYGVSASICEIYEFTATGEETSLPVKDCIHEGLDAPLAIFMDADENPTTGALNGREAYFYQGNPRGDLYSISDEQGNILERYDYSLFGERRILTPAHEVISEESPPSPLAESLGRTFGFGGAYHDEETGLIWMRHRYYDPKMRRFISRDPAEDDSLGNLYAAFENHPGKYRDPFGLESWREYLYKKMGQAANSVYKFLVATDETIENVKTGAINAGVDAVVGTGNILHDAGLNTAGYLYGVNVSGLHKSSLGKTLAETPPEYLPGLAFSATIATLDEAEAAISTLGTIYVYRALTQSTDGVPIELYEQSVGAGLFQTLSFDLGAYASFTKLASSKPSKKLVYYSSTGENFRSIAVPSYKTFWKGLKAKRRHPKLYKTSREKVIQFRKEQVAKLHKETQFQGNVIYEHSEGTSFYQRVPGDWKKGEITIKMHAFYERGGVKSVFLHEMAHSELPEWTLESMVDLHAVKIAEEIYGHSNDIVLPFVD